MMISRHCLSSNEIGIEIGHVLYISIWPGALRIPRRVSACMLHIVIMQVWVCRYLVSY